MKTARRVLSLLLAWIVVGLSLAQTPTPTPAALGAAEEAARLTGRLDARTPRQTYTFDGSRGEVVRLSLRATSGDLDPVLSLYDPLGQLVLTRDDSAEGLDVRANATLPSDGPYLLVIGRWGYGLGSSEGDYELSVERLGVLAAQGSTLRYGVPVTNLITDSQFEWYYTFRARQGDILNIELVRSSGTLDPLLKVLDSDRFLLDSNDDEAPDTRNAALRNFFVERDGVYVVVATRYGEAAGDSVGSFVLTISEAASSGVGNSPRAPAPIGYNQTLEASLDNRQSVRYYRFIGQEDDLITASAEQRSGRLDPVLTLADADMQPLRSDDDGGGGKNARIERFRLPYSGVFHLIVSRFDDNQGAFRLGLRRVGTAFEGFDPAMPRLLYGTTVQDAISESDPSSQYAFWGEVGDVVTIRMARTSGTLEPVLELLDDRGRRMFRADGTGEVVGFERLVLPATGAYIIYARRYEGNMRPANTTGDFRVTLALIERQPPPTPTR
ncbi:MAG: PPC domain-containing protein [Anaerolineae bacterium]|nr:PPC domain-containing protein [Anaerolineae bacterium]MDW8172253.1 PPC domain-containing protein [Anaerolineae bacterium]